MASRSRARGACAPYEVGYGRTPVHSRFKKGVSGNRAGRPKSRALALDAGPALGHLVQDAVLKVMGERVTFEVSSGRGQSMSRAEAVVRGLCDRAAYDHRAAKLLLEVFGVANYRQGELRKDEARAEEVRRQRERDEDDRRERARQRAEEEALEHRRQKNLRRKERAAEKRAAQAAAETARLLQVADQATVADQEAARQTLIGEDSDAELAPQGDEDLPGRGEDARLYEDVYERTPAPARRSRSGLVTRPEPAALVEAAPVPVTISAAAPTVPRRVPSRRLNDPLLQTTQPLTGHSHGLSGTSKPPPLKFT